ncbi:MAG: M20/M25/M40 family metallo-hydrolase, partial [Pseudomonadota bacterium]
MACEAFWDQVDAEGGDMVLTFGEFSTDPAEHGITKVPGRLTFTLDMRSQDQPTLTAFERTLADESARVSCDRGVEISLGLATHAAPAPMTPEIRTALQAAATSLGVPWCDIPSGGGHDCAVFAGLGVPVGMVFIRNEHGSHNPNEHIEMADFDHAARVLTRWAARTLFGSDLLPSGA